MAKIKTPTPYTLHVPDVNFAGYKQLKLDQVGCNDFDPYGLQINTQTTGKIEKQNKHTPQRRTITFSGGESRNFFDKQ